MIYFSFIRTQRIENNIENDSKTRRDNFCLAVSPIHSFLPHFLLIFSAENKRTDVDVNLTSEHLYVMFRNLISHFRIKFSVDNELTESVNDST